MRATKMERLRYNIRLTEVKCFNFVKNKALPKMF